MNKLRKLLSIVAACSMASTFNVQALQELSQRELSTILSQAVAGVNAETPMTLDEETRLDSAATARNLMIYNNTMVNYDANQLDTAIFTTNIQNLVIKPLCDNPGLDVFKQLKVILIYRYVGKDGEFIAELSKDMSTCK